MSTFGVYHDRDEMGYPWDSSLDFYTNKPITESIMGEEVFQFEGYRERGRKHKTIVLRRMSYINGQDGSDNYDFGGTILCQGGVEFDPPVILNEKPWFPDLMDAMGDFGFGFQSIKKQAALRGLHALVTREKKHHADTAYRHPHLG
jgi:hypothetical protein